MKNKKINATNVKERNKHLVSILRLGISQSVNHAVLETNEICIQLSEMASSLSNYSTRARVLSNCGKLDCKCRTSFKCL